MKWQNVLLLILILESCGKPDTKYRYISRFQASTACFPKGSYWIYQNDSTLIIDSVYVSSLSRSMQGRQSSGYTESMDETFECTAQSTIYPIRQVRYYVSPGVSYFSFSDSIHWTLSYSIESDKLKGPYTYHQIPTFTLNGLTFNNATELIEGHYGQNEFNYLVDGYVVPNAGLIKWDVQYKNSIHESWSLLRYKIVR